MICDARYAAVSRDVSMFSGSRHGLEEFSVDVYSGALVLHLNGSPNNLVQSHFYTKLLIAAAQPAEKYYCVPTEK